MNGEYCDESIGLFSYVCGGWGLFFMRMAISLLFLVPNCPLPSFPHFVQLYKF